MPLPLLFIGVAAASGLTGVKKGINALDETKTAQKVNSEAQLLADRATEEINFQRSACGRALSALGEEKVSMLHSTIIEFLDGFSQIKNVDFRQTEGLDELAHFHIDTRDFAELTNMVNFASTLVGGAVAGTASGALTAFGAYGAAQALACASTGTAIASLSGAAATNATLAFFGGGSLAAGGLGMAGGTAVLGGLVAGPALMVMGLFADRAAKKKLETAYINQAEAQQYAAQMDAASAQCEAIRRRTYMFYNLLAKLDALFLPAIFKMEDILRNEGLDYRYYRPESKKAIASCASIAQTIKAVLDTPILYDDGTLTDESEQKANETLEIIPTLMLAAQNP